MTTTADFPIAVGEKLPNHATLVAVNTNKFGDSVVLAISAFRPMEYVTWNADKQGHTFSGHYFSDFWQAAVDFSTRAGIADKPMTVIRLSCAECGKKVKVKVNLDDLGAWEDGKLIQDALPYLNDDEREMLKSSTCGDCWEKFFGGFDE